MVDGSAAANLPGRLVRDAVLVCVANCSGREDVACHGLDGLGSLRTKDSDGHTGSNRRH